MEKQEIKTIVTVGNSKIIIIDNIGKFEIINILNKHNINEKEYFIARVGY